MKSKSDIQCIFQLPRVGIGFLMVFLLWVVDWYSKTYILSGGSLDALLRPLDVSKAQEYEVGPIETWFSGVDGRNFLIGCQCKGRT